VPLEGSKLPTTNEEVQPHGRTSFYFPFIREIALTIIIKAIIMPNMKAMMTMVARAVREMNIENLFGD
jgi:hypothetical protein